MNVYKIQNSNEIKELESERAIGIAFSNEAAEAYIEKGYACILVSKDSDAIFGADALVYDEADLDDEYMEHVYKRHYKMLCDVLETERTFVREIGESDYEELKELYSHPEVTRFLEPLFEEEKEKQYQRDYYDNIYAFYDFGMWGVFDKKSGRMIGRCGIDPHEMGNELGYIIHPDFQRKGLAFEVCTAIIDYASEIGLDELWCKIDKENVASVGLAKKLGFGFVKEDWYKLDLKLLFTALHP